MLRSICLIISECSSKDPSLFPRLIQDVQTYVEQLGEACAANVAVTRYSALFGAQTGLPLGCDSEC